MRAHRRSPPTYLPSTNNHNDASNLSLEKRHTISARRRTSALDDLGSHTFRQSIMASSSTGALLMLCACRGVRGDSPGLKELMQLRVGGEVTAEDVYNFEVRPSMTRDMSFEVAVAELNRTKGEAFAAVWLTKLRNRANSIQQQRGGLYTGHHDCVRSVFCNLNAGSPEHAQMCFGCMLLLSNRSFNRRVRARTESGPEPAQTANYSTLTDDQKNKRLKERHDDAAVDAKREQRHDRSADRMLAAAHARFEVAQLEALSMLQWLRRVTRRMTPQKPARMARRWTRPSSPLRMLKMRTRCSAS